MQDMAGSRPQSDNGDNHYFSVVSDLMSLVEHIQASMRMLEMAIARECRTAIRMPMNCRRPG